MTRPRRTLITLAAVVLGCLAAALLSGRTIRWRPARAVPGRSRRWW